MMSAVDEPYVSRK